MSLPDSPLCHRTKNASKHRPTWLVELEDVIQAIEIMAVGFGLYDHSAQLVASNSSYFDGLAILGLESGPAARDGMTPVVVSARPATRPGRNRQ